MRHIKCYTSQQNIPGETFIMLKIKKSWVFGEISEIISTSPGDGCACQIPEVKKYAESRQELIAMIRQHMRFMKYFRKKCTVNMHWTGFYSIFSLSLIKNTLLFINPLFGRVFLSSVKFLCPFTFFIDWKNNLLHST